MQTFSDALLTEVQRLIGQEAELELSVLSVGNVTDYAAYREKVGRIFAYRKVVEELFSEAASNLEKR